MFLNVFMVGAAIFLVCWVIASSLGKFIFTKLDHYLLKIVFTIFMFLIAWIGSLAALASPYSPISETTDAVDLMSIAFVHAGIAAAVTWNTIKDFSKINHDMEPKQNKAKRKYKTSDYPLFLFAIVAIAGFIYMGVQNTSVQPDISPSIDNSPPVQVFSENESDQNIQEEAALDPRLDLSRFGTDPNEDLLSLAEQGDAESQYNLGLIYARGESVSKDLVEAAKWFTLAAEQGFPASQIALGQMHKNGEGVPQDINEAIKWYELAAEQGAVIAHYILAEIYEEGDGVPINLTEAAKWNRLLAETENGVGFFQTYAQRKLGGMYFIGEGVPQNYTEAASWFRLAADQGDAAAQSMLGNLYANGQGVPQNYTEALSWYRLGAEQGNVLALYQLGRMYLSGNGVPESRVRAYVWLSLSVAQGYEDGREGRDVLAGVLTPEQLARGQEIATRCFESSFQDCE